MGSPAHSQRRAFTADLLDALSTGIKAKYPAHLVDAQYADETDADRREAVEELLKECRKDLQGATHHRQGQVGSLQLYRDICKHALEWLTCVPFSTALRTSANSKAMQTLLRAHDAAFRSVCHATSMAPTNQHTSKYHVPWCLYAGRQTFDWMADKQRATLDMVIKDDSENSSMKEEVRFEGSRGDGSSYLLYGAAAPALIKMHEAKMRERTLRVGDKGEILESDHMPQMSSRTAETSKGKGHASIGCPGQQMTGQGLKP